jgi:cation diffusion facilitator family transporter
MQSQKEQVALTSMAASAALTIAKAVVGVSTGSLAILSEAGHSLIDFGATVMTYVAVRVSGKPADEQHHYGHGKVESISALGETALLFLLSGVVIWEALKRLLDHETHSVEATIWAFGVIVVSILVDFFRARALSQTAQATQSQALEADALHFSSDLWASLAVLVGLIGVYFGIAWADSAAALAVALLVCIAGWRLGKRTIDTLTDVAPVGAAAQIEKIACAVPGVVDVEHVRVRGVGDTIFVDLTVAVSRTLPLDRVNAIKEAVGAAITAGMPGAQPVVVVHPVALSNETVLDRVMVIARNRALAVHRLEHAIASELGSEVEVDTHIEPLEAQDALGREAMPERVRAVAMALAELAADGRVIRDVHDVRVRETDGGEIVNFHCRVAPEMTVQAVHENVDALERALRARSSSIKRVIGHAEPMK